MSATKRDRTWTNIINHASDTRHSNSSWINVKDMGASGSPFETTTSTKSGVSAITVKDVGDFAVGQGVMISKCHPRYDNAYLRGPGSWRDEQPLEGVVELRGFDGRDGDWLVFVLEIDGSTPVSFRWSDDLGHTWKGQNVPVTWDWQSLSGGLEIKFLKRNLVPGNGVTLSARTTLFTTIEKIEGNTLRLRDAPASSVDGARVRHCDGTALQAALEHAVRTRQNLYFPNGHYRLERGLFVKELVEDAAIVIEGASGSNTLLDISEGTGAVFTLESCKDVTIRNVKMIGHGGLDSGIGRIKTATGHPFWCMELKECRAALICGTERVLIENVHVSRMSVEAFMSIGPDRYGRLRRGSRHTQSLTYLRCTVRDCAHNAFNNNDFAEGTSVIHCRVEKVGSQAYEGPARFLKLIGNYIRGARNGFVIGNSAHLENGPVGLGQAVVADNVFEGCDGDNGGITVNCPAEQVIVARNIFVNWNSGPVIGSAIRVIGHSRMKTQSARNTIIIGNSIDLSWPNKRRHATGIMVHASNATVSDNQIFVRGRIDPKVTGVDVCESAVNVIVHDNSIRNCGCGFRCSRARSRVVEVFDERTFRDESLPRVRRDSHLYRGWNLLWRSGEHCDSTVSIEEFEPDEERRFRLSEPQRMQPGNVFQIFPNSANWLIHDNTITDCSYPVALESHGGATTVFRDNIISRGAAVDVAAAVVIRGQYKLIGNQVVGFDEENSAAFLLREARPTRRRVILKDNIVENCSNFVKVTDETLWENAIHQGNLFVATETLADQKINPLMIPPPKPLKKSILSATKLDAPVEIDGDVSGWSWDVSANVAVLSQNPIGVPITSPTGRVRAAFDEENLYFAMRFELPEGAELTSALAFDQGDGVEIALRCADIKHFTQTFTLWGSVGGTHSSGTYLGRMGASFERSEKLRKATVYAAKALPDGWSCECRLPFAALGLEANNVDSLLLNIGLKCVATGSRVVWAANRAHVGDVDLAMDVANELRTGRMDDPLCMFSDLDLAGELRLKR